MGNNENLYGLYRATSQYVVIYSPVMKVYTDVITLGILFRVPNFYYHKNLCQTYIS